MNIINRNEINSVNGDKLAKSSKFVVRTAGKCIVSQHRSERGAVEMVKYRNKVAVENGCEKDAEILEIV